MKKIIIVGGVAGGATAAARLRRLSETDQIIIFERDEYISYANCGLPYYIGDVITDRSKLLVQTVEGMKKRFNVDTRILTEVLSINKINKTVKVRNLQTKEEYEESYDKLILSPGAKAIKPTIKGIETVTNLFTLRNVNDADKIKKFIETNNVSKAVVIGGGFIGIEMAENLIHRRIDVTIIDLDKQILAPVDYEIAKIAEKEMIKHNVKFIFEDAVNEFINNKIVLNSGKQLDADLIILAIGVSPENTLAKSANLLLGKRGHIVTTKQLQTIDASTNEIIEDIYAIGDAIEVFDFIDNSKTAIALAWPANRQGRIVADHINGFPIEYKGTLGSFVIKIFDLVVASTGNNEKTLKRKGIEYKAIIVHRGNHAGYYPNATNLTLKLIFDDKTGKIYGAQAIGGEGTEKRIDVIATAIKANLSARDLADLELCYAPPFSSAKDPVNIAGYVAENVMNKQYSIVSYQHIDNIVNNGGYLLDVRTKAEYNQGHILGADNIPVDELRERLAEIKVNKDDEIYVSCQVGLRAYLAIKILQENGYKKLYNLTGGFKTYSDAKL